MAHRFDRVITGGTLVTADAVYPADVGIDGEQIAAIGKGLQGKETIDASNQLVLPGGVDVHVHLQYPVSGTRTVDTFFSGTQAAALGGTTFIIDFVEAKPAQPLAEALEQRRTEADGQVVVDYGLHITIQPSDLGKLHEVPMLVEVGCPSFKHYMAYGLRLNDGQMLAAFTAVAEANGLAIVHAENWDVIVALIAANLSAGRSTPRWHPRSRPPQFEGQAVGRAIDVAAFAGVPLHIFHVSCDAAVQRIQQARNRGLPVYAETCPQYLALDQSVYDRPGVEGALPVCAPPIRTPEEQEKLWAALARGDLQLVSTDHCPLDRSQKQAGMENFSRIPGGVPGIQSRIMLLYSLGVRTGRLSLSQWVRACCTMPARLMGLAHKGDIAVGYDADLVVFDPEATLTLSAETIAERVDWTPYDGMQMKGVPRYTLNRGRILVADGLFVGEAGTGKFLERRSPLLH